jgi:hypothetical protein
MPHAGRGERPEGAMRMETMSGQNPTTVDYYARDSSVFLDTHYLIKGVAGALFWKMVREHQYGWRSEFSLRELRLAGQELRLPEFRDNLSVRMLLLQRRLSDRGAAVQIMKVGRGRFGLAVHRPLRLQETPDRSVRAAARRAGTAVAG